jgi:hypothetical protein
MPGVGTTHHVKLDGHYYMVRPGSYSKRPAPQFGARFTTGDPDFNTLTLWQHWAQNCFIGGIDQDLWADDAMYDEGIGVDTSWHEKVTLSRNLLRGSGSNWGLASGTAAGDQGHLAVVYNNKLYVYSKPTAGTEGRLYRYDQSGDGWTRITSLDARNICGRTMCVFDGKLFIGGFSSTDGTPKIVYDDGALTSWSVLANPSGIPASQDVYAMAVFQKKMYVAYGVRVWRLKNDQTWDGNTEFYRANDNGSNYIVAMETHLGFLYMLSQNGHVHRTDGNATFDIWNWDGQCHGVSIRSFDGRLFILTYEFVETSSVGWGVLYQMSGSAMTQLKRFGDETNSNLIGNMRVFDRRLFYGASNGLGFDADRPVFGVAAYDPIEDSHCIIACSSDASSFSRGSTPYENWIVDDQIFFGGQLFAFVRGHGAFRTPYQHRDRERGIRRYDISAAGGALAPRAGGWLTTSTYDAGTPGVDKMWRKVVLDIETPTNTSFYLEYSTNNGESWTSWGGVSAGSSRAKVECWLENVKSTSLKLRITFRSTSATVTPLLYGYNVSYIPMPEPNWMWSFTVVLADKVVLLDGTTETMDTEAELLFLNGAYRDHLMLNFIDAEGEEWADSGQDGVIIHDIIYMLRDLNQPLEGEVTITLIEAVESY